MADEKLELKMAIKELYNHYRTNTSDEKKISEFFYEADQKFKKEKSKHLSAVKGKPSYPDFEKILNVTEQYSDLLYKAISSCKMNPSIDAGILNQLVEFKTKTQLEYGAMSEKFMNKGLTSDMEKQTYFSAGMTINNNLREYAGLKSNHLSDQQIFDNYGQFLKKLGNFLVKAAEYNQSQGIRMDLN